MAALPQTNADAEPIRAPCKTCRFYVRDQIKQGFCHRWPPTPIAIPVPNPLTGRLDVELRGQFPPVAVDTWCGEWRATFA